MSRIPTLGRRQVGGLAAGALAAATLPRTAFAADPTTFVSGNALPANLDPHQIFDVPMQALRLNTYDNLYRYQGNPPKIEAVAGGEPYRVAGRPDLGIQAPPGAKFHDGSALTAEDVVYSASGACWRSARRRPAPSCRC